MRLNLNINIFGSQVVLVPYKKMHVKKYHLWMQSPELLELTASEPLTLEQEYEMQESWLKDDDKCTFIVLDKKSLERTNSELESMIGDVNLYLNDQENPAIAEIEVMIAESSHRSKGKGKEALLSMLRYGIEALNIKEFVAKIKMKNLNSLHLFRSIGFQEVCRSTIFEEVELHCVVNVEWKTKLFTKTQFYRISDTG